jgi:hypothetical protein
MAEEMKARFTRARLAAIVQHELRDGGHHRAHSHVAIAPQMGYLIMIEDDDLVTIRLVEESGGV